MNTAAWGGPCWIFLHCTAANAPLAISAGEKHKYRVFFEKCLPELLPCSYCRKSLAEYVKELPIDAFLDTRGGLMYYLYLMHNKVNAKLDVPKNKWPSFGEVVMKYEKYRAKCGKASKGCVEPYVDKTYDELTKFIQQTEDKYAHLDIAAWTSQRMQHRLLVISIVVFVLLLLLYKFWPNLKMIRIRIVKK